MKMHFECISEYQTIRHEFPGVHLNILYFPTKFCGDKTFFVAYIKRQKNYIIGILEHRKLSFYTCHKKVLFLVKLSE
jgi:hypothetical protein